MTGTRTSGISDTGNMLMPDSSYTSRSRVARVRHGGLVRPDLVGARLGLVIRSIVGHCGAGMAEKIQSCLMEKREQELEAGARRVHPR